MMFKHRNDIQNKYVDRVIKSLKKTKILYRGGCFTTLKADSNLQGYKFSMIFSAGELVGEEKCIEGELKNFKYSLSYGDDINDIEAKQLFYKIGNSILMNVGY